MRARHAHAAYSLVLAEEVAFQKTPTELADWLARCDAERENHRAALAYLIETQNTAWALRLGAALYRYWEHREYLAEGRAWLEAILELPATAANTVGSCASAQLRGGSGVRDRAILASRAVVPARRSRSAGSSGTTRLSIAQLNSLWPSTNAGAGTTRRRGSGASRRCRRVASLDDKAAIAAALSNLADVVFLLGHHREARRACEEASAMFA